LYVLGIPGALLRNPWAELAVAARILTSENFTYAHFRELSTRPQ
jgi:hypothetical protein